MFAAKDSRLKIQRAKKHIADLNRELLTFKRSDPYRIVVDADKEPGFLILRPHQRRAIPTDWALLVGDAIHNLRSALDILACDIMRWHGRGVSSVNFPFVEAADDFCRVAKDRTIHRARPDVVDLFRAYQPFMPGNDLLHAIHRLDINDKHKLINTVASIRASGPLLVTQHGRPRIENISISLEHPDASFVRVPANAGFEFKYNKSAAFDITFGKGILEHKTLLPTLIQMAQLVEEIVGTFERVINTPRPTIYLPYCR